MRRAAQAVFMVMALVVTAAEAQTKKRDAPAPVAPATIAGVRYEAVPFGTARGLDQNGGYVAAVDAASGRELWVAKIYETPRDPGLEEDKQDVFITALIPVRGGAVLRVRTERGESFELDLRSRRARRL